MLYTIYVIASVDSSYEMLLMVFTPYNIMVSSMTLIGVLNIFTKAPKSCQFNKLYILIPCGFQHVS